MATKVIHLSAVIRGGDPGDIRGHGAGFVDFCRQFFARDGNWITCIFLEWPRGIDLWDLLHCRHVGQEAARVHEESRTEYELKNAFQNGGDSENTCDKMQELLRLVIER